MDRGSCQNPYHFTRRDESKRDDKKNDLRLAGIRVVGH